MTNQFLKDPNKAPFVSLCTPTFNRRPFFPYVAKCIASQDYPKERMEWIIIDDGTDPIEDLVADISYVKYHRYETKMTLGKKRNLMHEKCKGDILVYIDDDDFYPHCRVSHAVDTLLRNPEALCAGSSEMFIYFKHIHKMYSFGPYGAQHATAATFAFRRELLDQTSYDEEACVGEERKFLKDYTMPLVQLDSRKTILVFSHIHNSFDKKRILEPENANSKTMHRERTDVKVDDFIKDEDSKLFFMQDIDDILSRYEPGDPKNKEDVTRYMHILEKARNDALNALQSQIKQANDAMDKRVEEIRRSYEKRIGELTHENIMLKEKCEHVNAKMKGVLADMIQLKRSNALHQ